MKVKRGIVEIVQAMERSISWPFRELVFRGEPACFERVSSGLFRTYGLEKGEGGFNIKAVESEMVEMARLFTDRKDDFDILCEIQHRGGNTNQIDFTRDVAVALFFACGIASEREDEPGRVIMLDRAITEKEDSLSIRDITHPIHMAAAQKSVFVSTDSGYIDDRHLPYVHAWTIAADEKQEVLEYLKGARGIDSRSIFMDISGFIRKTHEFENANAWFYRGKKKYLQGDLIGAIEGTSNYLRLVGNGWEANPGLYIRGLAYFREGDRERAFQDLRMLQNVKKRVVKPGSASVFGRTDTTEVSAYPLPEDLQKELNNWCKEQERIKEEARRRERRPQGGKEGNWILRCVISASHMELTFDVVTDTGYSYRQGFGQDDDLVMTFPTYFLDYDAACWWTFYGTDHQYILLPRKTVRENIEVTVPPKPESSAKPSKVTVKFFAYDASTHELKKTDSGEFELVSLSLTE